MAKNRKNAAYQTSLCAVKKTKKAKSGIAKNKENKASDKEKFGLFLITR